MELEEIQRYLPKGAVVKQGDYRRVAHELVSADLDLITPAQVMDLCIKHPELFGTWLDTGLGVRDAGRRIEFYPDIMRTVTPNMELTNGGIAVPAGYSDGVISFDKSDFGPIRIDLTEEEASKHGGWLFLAGGDQNLLYAFVEKVFRIGRDMYSHNKMMGFSVSGDGIVRALVLGGADGRANAYGWSLNDSNARLVGVRHSLSVAEDTAQSSTDIESRVTSVEPTPVGRFRRLEAYPRGENL